MEDKLSSMIYHLYLCFFKTVEYSIFMLQHILIWEIVRYYLNRNKTKKQQLNDTRFLKSIAFPIVHIHLCFRLLKLCANWRNHQFKFRVWLLNQDGPAPLIFRARLIHSLNPQAKACLLPKVFNLSVKSNKKYLSSSITFLPLNLICFKLETTNK